MRALLASVLAVVIGLPAAALADPCGMVPPINLPAQITGPAIQRTGVQRTYVAFKDGVQTIALRPEFSGKVADFGMLIPFPSVPALRKVDDSLFAHVEGAIDPPTVQVTVYENRPYPSSPRYGRSMESSPLSSAGAQASGLALDRNEVVVLKEEAVGMYEVAVLAAGGAEALQTWMDEHEYQYPEGMGAVVEDYVGLKWCFVAIKTKVGQATGAHAAPGMRSADTSFPIGSAFDGAVQGMGFRFRVDAPVIPMRLSVFNGRDPHNVVYMLSDEALRIDSIPTDLVVRQVGGAELLANVTAALPVQYSPPGSESKLGPTGIERVRIARDATPINGVARDLFASDLLAVSGSSLSLPFEEEEKELLRVSEALGIRGEQIDRLHNEAIAVQRTTALEGALAALDGMTMSVMDGVFPGDVLESQNLTFAAFKLPPSKNARRNSPLRPPAPSLVLYERQ
jgi:hypothetical protein